MATQKKISAGKKPSSKLNPLATEEMVRITVDVPKRLHKQFKMMAVDRETDMSVIIRELMEGELKQWKK